MPESMFWYCSGRAGALGLNHTAGGVLSGCSSSKLNRFCPPNRYRASRSSRFFSRCPYRPYPIRWRRHSRRRHPGRSSSCRGIKAPLAKSMALISTTVGTCPSRNTHRLADRVHTTPGDATARRQRIGRSIHCGLCKIDSVIGISGRSAIRWLRSAEQAKYRYRAPNR